MKHYSCTRISRNWNLFPIHILFNLIQRLGQGQGKIDIGFINLICLELQTYKVHYLVIIVRTNYNHLDLNIRDIL